MSGDSKVDYVSQCTLEAFPHPWDNEIINISELSKPLDQYTWNMLHIRDSGVTLGGHLPSLGTKAVGLLGVALPPSSPTFRRYQKKKGD